MATTSHVTTYPCSLVTPAHDNYGRPLADDELPCGCPGAGFHGSVPTIGIAPWWSSQTPYEWRTDTAVVMRNVTTASALRAAAVNLAPREHDAWTALVTLQEKHYQTTPRATPFTASYSQLSGITGMFNKTIERSLKALQGMNVGGWRLELVEAGQRWSAEYPSVRIIDGERHYGGTAATFRFVRVPTTNTVDTTPQVRSGDRISISSQQPTSSAFAGLVFADVRDAFGIANMMVTPGSDIAQPVPSSASQTLQGAIVTYTDGACIPNPGAGGWAYRIEQPNGSVEERSGFEHDTTNNRMELCAIDEGVHRARLLDFGTSGRGENAGSQSRLRENRRSSQRHGTVRVSGLLFVTDRRA